MVGCTKHFLFSLAKLYSMADRIMLRFILVVHVSYGPRREAGLIVDERRVAKLFPDCATKRMHQVRTVQERPACPELAVSRPALFDPVCCGRLPSQLVDHQTRPCRRFPLQEAGHHGDDDAAANRKEGSTFLEAFAHES